MKIFLSTGGNLYLKYKDKIENLITKLSLPLDGYTAEINLLNGRTKDNYQNVLSILDYYKTNPKDFQIKISSLLTSRNIAIDNNLIGIYNLLIDYPIDIWKIYEILPEGKAIQNYDAVVYPTYLYTLATDTLNKKIDTAPKFPVILSKRNERDLGYFIIQPNGDVIIPKDCDVNINENFLGNILTDSIEEIISKWQNAVNYTNYLANIRLLDHKYILSELDKKILFELDRDPRQSLDNLSEVIKHPDNVINDRIKFLFNTGIIKNIIPVMNLDKLGFMIFLVNLTLEDIDKSTYQKIIDNLVNNSNVAWVVGCSGKWTIMIALFAKNAEQFTKIMMDLTNYCGEKLISHDTHIVSEKYVLGQRYLLIKDKKTDFIFDRSRICLNYEEIAKLNVEEYMILSKIRESREGSISYISKQLDMPLIDVEKIIENLQKIDVLKKFQPVYDVSLLGYEWYEVFIKFKNLSETKKRKFINYVHSLPQAVHINCTIGAWDINFEFHCENKNEFDDIYSDIKEKFNDMILKEDFVIIGDEYKFDFLVDVVLEEGLGLRKK